MTRRSKFLVFLPALVLLMLTLLMAWLLRTETGAGFIWTQASELMDGQIKAERLTGSLSSRLALHGFEFVNESVRVESPEISLSLDFDLFPPGVRLSQLQSKSVEVHLLSDSTEDSDTELSETLSNLKLPFALRLDAVQLASLQIVDVDGEEMFGAQDVRLAADWHDDFRLRQLEMHSLDTDWNITAELELKPPFALQGKINADSELTVADHQTQSVNWQSEFVGNLKDLGTRLQLTQPAVFVEGRLLDLLTDPAWDLQLQSAQLTWPLAAAGPNADPDSPGSAASPLFLRDIQLSSQGKLAAYELQMAAELSGEQIPGGTMELVGIGEPTGMRFEHLRFEGAELSLTGTGALDWQEALTISIVGAIDQLQPQRWLADWPSEHPINGDVTLQLVDQQLEFSNVALQITGLDAEVHGNGRYSLIDDQVSADLTWQSLVWPIAAVPDLSTTRLASRTGQMSLVGRVDDWNATGQLQLQVDDYPEGLVQLRATGTEDAVQLVIDKGEVMGGQFAGNLDYQWAEPGNWSALITAKQVSTTALLPDYPGVLSGTVSARGASNSSNLQIDLRDITGQIRGREISARGKFSLQDSIIEAKDLLLLSGSSRVSLDGGLGAGQTLRFDAKIADVSELWPESSGRLEANGKIMLDSRSPQLDIDIEADELIWGDNHIESIRTVNGSDGSRIIRIEKATLAGKEMKDVQLTLAGDQALESVQLQGQMDKTQFTAALRGQLQANLQKQISGWSGVLENLRLSQPEQGFLNLEEPASLSFSIQESSLGPACLRGSRDGLICLQGRWSEQGPSSMQAEVQQVSLDIVRLFVEMDWAFTHRLEGRFDWQKSPQQSASAQANFSLSEGELLFEQDSTNFSTGAGQLEFQISEGNLHSGNLSLPIPGSGGIETDFNVTSLLAGSTAELQAAIRLNLKELAPLQLFVPQIDVIKGELNADIRIAGSLEDPQFTGHATLVRGRIEKESIGLVLSEIQLAGAVYQYDHTELNGSFRAGKGRGQIKADLRFEDFLHPQFKLELVGEELLLVDVPDMNLLANPDLVIQWTPGQLQLHGRVLVPEAQLSPRYLPASSVSESPDLVIVSDSQAVEVAPSPESTPLKIKGEVEVELGNRVNLTLDKATANISGKTKFNWNDKLLPTGDGGFRVSGEIYAYGQLLTISEGRVSFPRIPADNPNLNIKAEREIFGNTQIKKAGVRVGGSLKRPTLEPYTDPLTTRERSLALLLTGSDFDYEQGVGAVEVGMYIAPKLFISYGIGLFEDQNVISARYDLGRGFGVKATSGQRETGVDISYTIEH